MHGPAVFLSTPPWQHIKFPPDALPAALPPPAEYGTLKSPFHIPSDLYNDALAARVPLTIAAVYIATALTLNQVNRYRVYKPYAFSKTRLFYYFVLLHNISLAVFSAVSCIGIVNALRVSLPGFTGEHGLPGTIDALCRLNGPRGYGDAVTFNASTSVWETKNRLIRLASNGLTPDDSDVGRIWNEGLAFWGWFFYLSKFYEVVDTAILLAKGKRSPTLQTYHHAGAMMCMWAGIRYMSPPIWMWVALNSLIHTIMYTYYTLSSMRVRVPAIFKQTLTVLQITQLTVGVAFAASHLFVSYTVPVSVPFSVASAVFAAPSSIASAIHKVAPASQLSSLAAAATPGNLGWLKKLAFRAAGAEGLAENVRNVEAPSFGGGYRVPEMANVAADVQKTVNEIRYRTEYQVVDCIETSGQAFAVWLNVLYLLPLIVLFVRFFYKAYVSKTLGAKVAQRIAKSKAAAQKALEEAAAATAEKSENHDLSHSNGWHGDAKVAGKKSATAESEAEWFGGKSKSKKA